jgi:hypothetical protein
MNSQKAEKPRFSSFRRKPESSHIKWFWTPAFAGVTAWWTSNEVEAFSCGSGILPRQYRGWKPLPQGRHFIADRMAQRAITRFLRSHHF